MKRPTLWCSSCSAYAPLYGLPRRTTSDCGTCVARHLGHLERQRARHIDVRGWGVTLLTVLCGSTGLGLVASGGRG